MLAVLAAGLAGCANPNSFAPACPRLAFLREGADLNRFDGKGHDITDQVFGARLTAVPPATGSCRWANRAQTAVEVRMQVAMTATRGPQLHGNSVELPFFVAVTEGQNVLDRQLYTVRANFGSNVDTASVVSAPIVLRLPVSPERSAAAYEVWVSFQLTPDEMAYNRRQLGEQ